MKELEFKKNKKEDMFIYLHVDNISYESLAAKEPDLKNFLQTGEIFAHQESRHLRNEVMWKMFNPHGSKLLRSIYFSLGFDFFSFCLCTTDFR
ncbi:MAG: hypothetical protein WD431_00140 [Cyclobacteriaceae bacterium]